MMYFGLVIHATTYIAIIIKRGRKTEEIFILVITSKFPLTQTSPYFILFFF